ncbi:MAG: ankyrin repeat domain-containing protein [Stenotrophomonas sp.]
MTEPLRRRAIAIALAAGAVLTLLAGFGGVVAALGGWLAQPAFALAASWWRRTRTPVAATAVFQQQLPPLLALWSAGPLGLALLVSWPLAAVHASGSLSSVLALSIAVSLALLALWRTWPVWQGVEQEGGALTAQWQASAGRGLHSWHGLGGAALVLLICAAVVLPAWPGLLAEAVRWPLAVASALLSPLVHGLLQALRAVPAVPSAVAAVETFDPFADAAAAPVPLEPIAQHELVPKLYEAARAGRVDRALQLLEAGADAHALPQSDWRDQRSLGVLAAVLPDLRLLRALISARVNVNQPHRGMTPLLAATRDSWHGRPEAVMTLLANGADPRARDAEGNTPLHHAARSSDPGVAALLRDAAAEIDALNNEGHSPLALACQAGNWRLAKFLLERGAKPEPVDGVPVLVSAAGTDEDDPAGVQLLLKHKARLDARDRQRRSALHEAAQAGHVEIVEVLLNAGTNIEARDALARTPWLEAARHARAEVMERLLVHKPQIDVVDAEGGNAILLACQAENVSATLIRRLLELGVAADVPNTDGRRALDFAAEAGRWAIVSQLDPAYPLPAAVTDTQPSSAAAAAADATSLLPDRAPLVLLREALGFGNLDGMAALARLCGADELGALLHDPQLVLQPRVVEWLLGQGASPEVRDACGDTPMFALLARGVDAVPTLQVLLRHGVSPAGGGGLARLLAACVQHDHGSRGMEQFALELLERGADPFAPAPAGDPPLSLAVRLGWLKLQQWLLDNGADREARDSHGMTALHLATALAREASLKLLVRQGASPEARAADGQTPLGVALSIGRRDLADWLDWRGWSLPLRPLRDADVPAAAMAGDVDAVRRLIDLGSPVDAVDAQGCTALLRAAGGGHAAVVDLLLARGANPQHAASSGATPLSAAVSMRQTGIVAALLDAGAQLEHRLPGGVTVLMLAAALGLPDIVARLLTAGADVHAGDDQQLEPLHCAALYGFTARDRSRLLALLDTLLLAGAEADHSSAGTVTPLLLLLGARAEPGTACDEHVVLAAVERLLDEDVSLDVRDPRGFGPLHLAALHGLPLLVQRLLRAGADPDLRDALNRTPREIAIMRGFIDVAGEFEPAVPGVSSMARFLRDRG